MARSDSSKNTGSDSSRKVAKAAKAGQTPSAAAGREQRELGFPLAMGAVMVVGILLVIFSWNARDVQALSPSFDDHWHIAYGIYECDTFQPNLEDPQTPNSGIHTHGDGVVHLHPRSSDATGNNAQMKRFLEAARVEISDSEISFPDRPALSEDGAECNGEPAILQIVRFNPGEDVPSEIFTEDLGNYRFQEDQERIVIALAPAGAAIPPPPQVNIDNASAASPSILGTEGLNDLGLFGSGFDEDGNLLDADGELVLDDDGNPINIADLTEDSDGSDSDSSDSEGSDTDEADADGDSG